MDTVTIKDIARICDVGVSTVSRAINNQTGISVETKNRILKIIEENNYIPNNSARNLKKIESNTIAILVKAIDNPLFSKMIRVYEKEIKKQKFDFFLQHIDSNQDEISVAIEIAKERKLKGIIFLGGDFNYKKEQLKLLKIPFVLSTVGTYDDIIDDILACSVSIDDTKESYKMIDYLCKLGHRKIAILCASEADESIGKLRLEGYKKALLDNAITIDEKLIVSMKNHYEPYSMRSGYEMAKELLARDVECTAIFAISDLIAIGASKAIFNSGKKIPDEFAIAGFDGLDETIYYEPSITTIEQPLGKIAKASIHALFSMIFNEKRVKNKVFEGKLTIRESTKKI